jgi:hypothetical protein
VLYVEGDVAFDLANFTAAWLLKSLAEYFNIATMKKLVERGVRTLNCGGTLNKDLEAFKLHWPHQVVPSWSYSRQKAGAGVLAKAEVSIEATAVAAADAAATEADVHRRLLALAAEIKESCEEINVSFAELESAKRRVVSYAIKCGTALNEAKKLVRRGKWMEWVEAKFPRSHSLANLYMALAREPNSESIQNRLLSDLAKSGRRPYKQKTEQIDSTKARRRRETEQYFTEIAEEIGGLPSSDRDFEKLEQLAKRISSDNKLPKFFAEQVREWTLHQAIRLPQRLRDRKLSTSLFVDSGAYSAWNAGDTIDLNKYSEFLKANGEIIDYYAALDVINTADPEEGAAKSFENFERMRDDKLEDAIPVFHIGEDFSWLEKILKADAKYIGLSASSLGTKPDKEDEFYKRAWSYLMDGNGWPIVKVHAFGLAQPKTLLRYPWASADSANWINPTRYGSPEGRDTRSKSGLATETYREAWASATCERLAHHLQGDVRFQLLLFDRGQPRLGLSDALRDLPLESAGVVLAPQRQPEEHRKTPSIHEGSEDDDGGETVQTKLRSLSKNSERGRATTSI